MDITTIAATALLIGGIGTGFFLRFLFKASDPEGDWWEPEPDTTVEHRTRMFQGRDVTEIGRTPDAET